MIHYHDGVHDFPHGAGPSEVGYYYYPFADLSAEPLGPYVTEAEAWLSGHAWEYNQ
jgi:hypothetical protein